MNAPQRLGLYGAGLAVLFAAAFAVSGAVVPEGTAAAWTAEARGDGAEHTDAATDDAAGGHGDPAGGGWAPATGAHDDSATDAHDDAGQDGHGGSTAGGGHGGSGGAASVRGLSLEQDGLLLSPVRAPAEVGDEGALSFTVTTADGAPVTEFATEHDKELHLIVVRSDGAGFRHVHPTMAADGTWSLPWAWDEAGSYRVYADFVPAATGENVTLSRTVDVAGRVRAEPPAEATASDTVDGYTVTLTGDLSTAGESVLTARVTRDGEPVTTLEPYLGAFGHLVALRDGDLAYLHVHPEGDEPETGSVSGPDVTFVTSAPTPGRYLLYLDFKVDGVVRTAHLVLDADS